MGSSMNYKASKFSIIVSCSLFMLIGCGAIIISIVSGFNLFGLFWGSMFVAIPFLIMKSRISQLSMFEKMTYERYRELHPNNVRDNRVSCYSCGNSRINVRSLLNRTYHREHFCSQCGKSLFFSKELIN